MRATNGTTTPKLAFALALGALVTGTAFAAEESAEPAEELLPNQVRVSDQILVGGQPSIEQLEALHAAGYRTVLNLRTEQEEGPAGAEAETLGLMFHRLPIAGEDGLDEENARLFATLLEEADGPVVVHCGSGNRVGALFALKAFYVDGMDADEALAVGLASGLTSLEPSVRRHLEQARSDP